ncbi:MAG: carboxymuconolactone decarboxylase family protein [Gammaproteobacteria bacterium]|nr:carboxymuconolactone decarboxylase family protein [Gammaproteobacteria bacterium]
MTKPTPHLKKVSKSKLPDDMKQSWDQANHLTGDATFVEVSGNNPDVYRWYLDEFYQKLFYSDRLETTLVELISLRLANVHGCAFCNKGDTAHALKSGITQEQIDALDDYMIGPFSDREKSALKLADQMVLTNEKGNISSDLYSELNAHFNDGEIYELGMIMAVLVGVAKFTFVYDLVEKEDYCPF